ncbi:sodium:proton antiporter [Enemella dayhoffiae]|uniref:Sodium:proton antiporter n=1 Tax=Enemella dayhoffiae TaxID=2016507 RepID=A0A255GRX0_9ACTN|nr:sodium:proton antiporter [Enemella dayhoffiae]
MRPVFGWLVGGLLTLAAVLTVVRIVRGPSSLNRTLATDVLVTTLICGIAAEAILARHASTLPILVSLSLVAFVGSVSVARFVARDTDLSDHHDGRNR